MAIETPVLIVGGGGAGLTASMLLSKLEIQHILVSLAGPHILAPQGARAQSAHVGDL